MDKKYRINNTDLILTEGDITDLDVDAIINAANSQLIMGSGVAGAISEKGGPSIQEECDRLGGTYVGGAVMTGAGNLKARNIIHAVGPRNGEGDEELKLRNATMNSLLVAEEHNLTSIAFPAISTGVFGFPVDKCAEIMLTVTVEYLKRPSKIFRVIFCLLGEENFNTFEKVMAKLA